MSETTVVEQTQMPLGVEVITPSGNLFSDDAWSTSPASTVAQQQQENAVASPAKTEPTATTTEPTEEIVDELEYLERQTGYKSWDEVKNMQAKLREFEGKPQAPEIKFQNDHSKKLFDAWTEGKEDDVYNYLHTQRELKKAADLPAADAIRMHLKLTNPHYKNEDIEDVFDERYTMPRKPIQGADEEKEAFDERMTEYSTRVAKINRAIERDAFAAKQELANRITQLVPPEIQKPQQPQGPDPKVLEQMEAAKNGFIQQLEAEFNGLDGFNTKVKDESVELPIAFKVDDKDKSDLKAIIQNAVFKDMDVNPYFTNRWFTKDANGSLVLNTSKMMSDFMLLEKTDKVLQGISNNSAASRMAHQLKINSNIKVNGETPVVQMNQGGGTEAERIQAHFWSNPNL